MIEQELLTLDIAPRRHRAARAAVPDNSAQQAELLAVLVRIADALEGANAIAKESGKTLTDIAAGIEDMEGAL